MKLEGEEQRKGQCAKKKEETPLPELTQAQIDEMQDWFYFFDKNGDNRLDVKELDMVFHALCWDLTNQELEDVMKDADTNDNGFLEFDEYMRLLNTYRKDPSKERAELIQAFGYFDKDKNGWLDRNELTRLLLSFGECYTKGDRKLLDCTISKMDKNGDGKIDIEEFVEAMLDKPR